MKANELMIGDWVMLTDPINNGEKVQVKEIHGDGHITVDGAITKMFEPIPLTAEILEKNGFEYFSVNYWEMQVDNDYIELRPTEGNMAIWLDYVKDNDGIYANYILPYPDNLHELQHALRLCNIEKEIEI